MWASILYFAVAYILAREISSYNELYIFKSHVVLKSKIASALLVGRFYAKKHKTNKKKGDEMKMTLIGIVYYVLLAVIVAVSILILYIVPDSPCESFDMGKVGLYGNTYNEYAVAHITCAALTLGMGLVTLHTQLGKNLPRGDAKKEIIPQTISIFLLVVAVIFFVFSLENISML